jgi:hypothetical protein
LKSHQTTAVVQAAVVFDPAVVGWVAVAAVPAVAVAVGQAAVQLV